MVRSRDVVQAEDRRGRREPEGRLESVPTGRRPGRAPWRRGSGGAPAGSATWCCGCCVAHRWRRCPVRRRGDLPARSVAGAGHGWPRARLKGSSRRARGGDARRGEASHRGAVDGDRAAPRAGPGRGAAPPFGDAEVATMSATTSAATGRCFGIQRGVSGLGALALGALRAAGAGTPPPAGRGAGAGGGRCRGNRHAQLLR